MKEFTTIYINKMNYQNKNQDYIKIQIRIKLNNAKQKM